MRIAVMGTAPTYGGRLYDLLRQSRDAVPVMGGDFLNVDTDEYIAANPEMLSAVRYTREEIAAIFQVPLHMLGWQDHGLLRAKHNRIHLRASRAVKPAKYRHLLRRTH